MDPIHSKCVNHEHIAVDGTISGDGNFSLKSIGSSSSISMSKFNNSLLGGLKHQHIETNAIQPQQSHQLVSTNSFELNGVTSSSLSEDSGLALTTNSSISSGDSSRFGLCKNASEVRIVVNWLPQTLIITNYYFILAD